VHLPFADNISSMGDTPHGHLTRRLLLIGCKVILIAIGTAFAFIGLSTVSMDRPIDFLAYYGAARHLLDGLSPYGLYATAYGYSVFQSPLWLAWLFTPMAIMPMHSAWLLFVVINICLLILCLVIIARFHNTNVSPIVFAYILSCTLGISFIQIRFGQVTVIQLFAFVLIICAMRSRQMVIAGLLVPLALLKPHLLIFFLPSAFLRGDRKLLLSAFVSTLALMALAFWLRPAWLHDLVDTFISGQRASDMAPWKFMTLTGHFSLPPWAGLLVPPLSLPIIIWSERKFRAMPTSTWLSVALALSLAFTPYAFAYDLPLLLPVLVWLSLPWSWW